MAGRKEGMKQQLGEVSLANIPPIQSSECSVVCFKEKVSPLTHISVEMIARRVKMGAAKESRFGGKEEGRFAKGKG